MRQYLPVTYVGLALVIGGLVLPSALRPPPNPAQSSNALDPNAPPNHNPNQVLESLQQTGGGGAGAGVNARPKPTPSTSVPVPTPSAPSLEYCYGNPPRQIPSIYAGPCVGAWQGNNGGATAFNVFPNEVRLGFAAPGWTGQIPDPSTNNASTSSSTQTYQALQQYFNEHYQFYGRRLVFYGLDNPAQTTADSYAASAKTSADTYHLFVLDDKFADRCQDAASDRVVTFCAELPQQQYVKHAPYLYTSDAMTEEDVERFGAEFGCKSLVGKDSQWAGPGSSNKARKFGFLTYQSLDGGFPGAPFAADFSSQCHGNVEIATLSGTQDTQGALSAMAKFAADGVTTVFAVPGDVNLLLAMEAAAKSSYYPEWVELGTESLDVSGIAQLLPTEETQHLFGISALEWPRHLADTDCAQAVHSVNPSLAVSDTACQFTWAELVWIANGIQGAGPHLTPATFRQAEYQVGFRFSLTPWMMGGGFGPGVYAWPHSISEIWFNPSVVDPTTGNPGAYEYLFGGRKFELGQLPSNTSEFFKSGQVTASNSCTPSKPPC